MQNRALAADMLMTLANRRHDLPTAGEYAARTERAGEDLVRFNPSDLNSWWYWVRGKESVADWLFEQGRIAESTAVFRSAVALEEDSRKPTPLGPLLPFTWASLAFLQAESDEYAAAATSIDEAARASALWIGPVPEDSSRHVMGRLIPEAWQARLQLIRGENGPARERAATVVDSIKALELPEEDSTGLIFRANMLRFSLGTLSKAALRTGHPAQAEKAAIDRLALPRDSFRSNDPQDEISRARMDVAHAAVMQGRGGEALAMIEPDLARYRAEQARGASGLRFQRDFAYALYVSAIAQPDDATGRERRRAALTESAELLGDLSGEARRLRETRALGDWIAAAGGPTYQR
jgi:hypothetical protein